MRQVARIVGLVATGLALLTVVGFAQSTTVPKRIGVLALSDADSIHALFQSLHDYGWVDGTTIAIVFPQASPDPDKLAANMQDILAAKVDVVVAQTKLAIQIAKRATGTVPIVMGALNGDPVAEGFAQSVERPGGNITGSYYNVAAGGAERVAVLADLVPAMTHAGILFNPDSAPSMALADDLAAAAVKRGLQVMRLPVRGAFSVDIAFAAAKAKGIEGIVAVTGAEMFALRADIVAAQDKYRIAAVTGSIGFAAMGGLAKLGPDIPALWRKMAPAVDQLLKGSARPGDLPLVTLDTFELDINLRTAQAFGLTVPESMKQRAARVFQ
jgi:putative tryptophan/tyrosine transport system substrate-binding protein